MKLYHFSVIEKYTENVRFCIICNYLGKIIPALQSRCTRFRFGPLKTKQILPRLDLVIDQEKYDFSLTFGLFTFRKNKNFHCNLFCFDSVSK